MDITPSKDVSVIMKPTYQTPASARYSNHADLRMQQRCIPAAAVELLLDFAPSTPVGGGASSYRFTRESWAEAQAALGKTATALAKFRNAYVVESADGVIITAAWVH